MHTTILSPGAKWYKKLGYEKAWNDGLRDEGVETTVLDGSEGVDLTTFETDFVIPHVLVDDYATNSPLWDLAKRFEATGVPLLNSIASLALTADKFETYLQWREDGIKQPDTYLLRDLSVWPKPGERMVLKPSFCDGGHYVQWVDNLYQAQSIAETWAQDEANGGERRGDAILQEYLGDPECLRIISSPNDHLLCYEKATPAGQLLSVGSERRIFEPDSALRKFAHKMVESCGGGLMGADVIISGGEKYALEINGPFGFDTHNKELHASMAKFVIGRIQSSTNS